MNNILQKADYMLALKTDTMTDEIRENYFVYLELNKDLYLDGFALILDTIIKKIINNTLTSEKGIEIIKNEYSKLDMDIFFGDFLNIFPLISLLINRAKNEEGVNINILKQYIDIANNLNCEEIAISINYVVLNFLMVSNIIDEDIDFTKSVMEKVRAHGVMSNSDKVFLNIIFNSINSYK